MPYIADRKARDESFTEDDFNAVNNEIWGEVGEYYPPRQPTSKPTVQEDDAEQKKFIGAMAYGAVENQVRSDDVNQLRNADGTRSSVTGFTQAPTSTHQEQQAQELAKLEEAPGFLDTIANARDEVWASHGLTRMLERAQDENYDIDYRVPAEAIEEFASTHSLQELEYISDSTSDTNLLTRLEDIESDRFRRQKLSDAGALGLGAQLTLSILDPSAIVLSLVSAPLVMSQKVGAVGNILRVGTLSAVENMAIESVLVAGNTQSDENDIYMAGIGGFVLGGAIGGLTRTRAVDNGTQGQVDAFDSMDIVANDISTRYRHAKDLSQAEEVLNSQALNTVANKIEMHKASLIQKSGKPLGKAQRKQLESNGKTHKKGLASLDKAHNTELKRISEMTPHGKKGSKATKAKFARQKNNALNVENAKYISARANLSAKIESVDIRLQQSIDKADATTELARFNKLTAKQQEAELFPFRTDDFQARYVKSKLKRQEAALRSHKASIKEDQVKPGESTDGAPTGKDASAAKTVEPQYEPYSNPRGRNEEIIDDILDKTSKAELKDGRNAQMGRFMPNWLKTDYTNIDASDNLFARALNRLFNENSQLGGDTTVSSITHSNLADIKHAGKNAYDRGMQLFAEEQGTNIVKVAMSPKLRDSYNEQVVHAIKEINTGEISPSIKMASEGLRDQMAHATMLRKQNGELGFSDLDTVANYFPDLMEAAKATNRFNKAGWGDEDGIQLLTKGYMQGDNSLSVRQAEAMAGIKYRNMMDNQLVSIDDVNNVFRSDSLKGAKRVLTENGFSKDEARKILEDIMDGDDWVQVSGRAKKSYNIDWDASHSAHGETIKIGDLMDTNAGRVVESYTNESALGAALAEKGIKSRGQLERFIEDIQKSSANSAIWDKATAVRMKADMDEAVELIKNTITQLGGKSLINYKSTANRIGRLARDTTGILRLQQILFSTVPELSRGITQAGLSGILKAVPSAGMFRLPNLRSKGGQWASRDANFELKNPELREMEEVLGYVGEKDLNASLHIRSEDASVQKTDSAGMRLLTKLEEAAEGGKRVSGWMSGFNTVQGGIEKIVTNAVNRKMLNFALNKGKLSKSLTNQIEMTGMGDSWTKVQSWVKANKGSDSFNGRSVDTWNYKNMPPEIKRDFQTMMQRLTRRTVQRTNAGEQNSSWLGPLGSFLTQFRNYTLGTIEKQIAADWRGDKTGMATNFLWSTGLAYASYMTQVSIRANAMGDKADDYYERATGEGLFWGVMSKHSQMAALGIVSDLAMATGTAPDELYDSGRIGQQRGNPSGLIPALGLATDVMGLGGSASNLVFEGVREDGDMGEAGKDLWNKTNRLMPLMNTLYIGDGIRTITGLNED